MGDPSIHALLQKILENQKKEIRSQKVNIHHRPNISDIIKVPHIHNPNANMYKSIDEMPINPRPFTCDMVIARYKEKLPWLPQYNKYKFRNVYIYNKNEADNNKTSKDLGCILNSKECIKINLKNEGRCDHTYLYHIIHKYNNLADVTIFTKGSSDMFREVTKLKFTVAKVFETQNTVLSVDTRPTPIHIDQRSFQLDTYRSSHKDNNDGELNIKSFKMKPAPIRPFGKWYETYFPGVTVFKAVYAGIFALSRKQIHMKPKSYYESLIPQLEGHSNPEVGHYFERAWLAIFNPIPEEHLYESFMSSFIRGGSLTRRKRRDLKRKRRVQKKKTRRSKTRCSVR
jgi:hypothetical protein